MFKVIGGDGQEYGPVSTETLREWIRHGRAQAQTKVLPEGAAHWQPLASLPEFQADLAPNPPGSSAFLPAKTSGLAITSLVLGALGILSCGLTSLVGLVLGIVALVKINKSQGRLSGNGLAIAGIAISAVFLLLIPVFAAMLLPALAQAKSKAQTITCVNNLKQLGLATRMYAMDHDDVFPDPQVWSDALTTNGLVPSSVLQCPSHNGRCAYAYNVNLKGLKDGEADPDLVMFFESDAGWNAAGGPELMISQPRHGGVFNFGFADGSVSQLSPAQTNTLHWKP